MTIINRTSDRHIKKAVTDTRSRSKKIGGIRLLGRVLLFFLLYFGWPLVRRCFRPIVFAVYGTKKDQRAYWPDWIHQHLRGAFPIGLLQFGHRWGFVTACPSTAEDFVENPELAMEYIRQLRREFPKAKVVALAGGLPGWALRAGGALEAPFVEGSLGTRYTMFAASLHAARVLGKDPKKVTLGLIGGAGYTGSQVVADTAKEFKKVVALDPKYKGQRRFDCGVLYTDDPNDIRVVEVAIVLTRKGDDIAEMVLYFIPETVVVDDTHPCISPAVQDELLKRGVDLWKAVMADSSLQMIPRMPNFRGDNVPGCLLEALVVLERGRDVLTSPETFFQAAAELGFRAKLMRHPDN